MKQTAADILVEALCEREVKVVFGMPGEGINWIVESLRKRDDTIRFASVRHAESAAFMACGYAKYTGRMGVCLAASGPGAVHLLNGLYDAKFDKQPVLAITGGRQGEGRYPAGRLFDDVCLYNEQLSAVEHVKSLTDSAFRTAVNRLGAAHIFMPSQLQKKKT